MSYSVKYNVSYEWYVCAPVIQRQMGPTPQPLASYQGILACWGDNSLLAQGMCGVPGPVLEFLSVEALYIQAP